MDDPDLIRYIVRDLMRTGPAWDRRNPPPIKPKKVAHLLILMYFYYLFNDLWRGFNNVEEEDRFVMAFFYFVPAAVLFACAMYDLATGRERIWIQFLWYHVMVLRPRAE